MRLSSILSKWTLVLTLSVGVGLVGAACPGTSNTGDPDNPNPGSSDLLDPAADLTGGGSGSDLAGNPPPTVDAACDANAQTSCTKQLECSPFGYNVSQSSMAGCVARFKQLCLRNFGLTGSKRTTSDVQRCAAAQLPLSCQDYYDGTHAVSVSCRIPGTLADGVACGSSDQCQSSNCNISPTTGCGVCAPYLKAGSACQVTVGAQACEPGTNCVGPTGALKCTAASGLGGACNYTSGPYCKFPLACRGGVCATPRNAGDTCDSSVSYECDATKDLLCNGTSKKCEQLYRYAAVGAACGSSAMPPFTYCSGNARCSVTTGTGTCIAPAADGNACADPPATPSCMALSSCKSGTCQFPNPASCK